MKKKLKIGLIIILALFTLYKIFFVKINIWCVGAEKLEANYGEYILWSADDFDWLRLESNPLFGDWGMAGEAQKNIYMFRWKASAMKEKMEKDFLEKMDKLKEYPFVTEYTYDPKTLNLDIYVDESKVTDMEEYYDVRFYLTRGLVETVYTNEGNFNEGDYSLLGKVFDELRWFGRYEQDYNLHIKEEKDNATYEIKCSPTDLQYLEEIVSRYQIEVSDKLEEWSRIQWLLSDRVYKIGQLDFSGLEQVSGSLDLSVLSELEGVILEGTKVEQVILPETLNVIDEKTFSECEFLEKVVITGDLQEINIKSFWGCKRLKEIVFKGNAPKIIGGGLAIRNDVVIYYDESKRGWRDECWKQYNMKSMRKNKE